MRLNWILDKGPKKLYQIICLRFFLSHTILNFYDSSQGNIVEEQILGYTSLETKADPTVDFKFRYVLLDIYISDKYLDGNWHFI